MKQLRRVASITRNRSRAVARRVGFAVFGPKRPLDPREALVICSDPRGGSTWLTEMLARIPGTALIWEPLHIGSVAHFRKIGFGWREYIKEEEEAPAARQSFELVFRGMVREPYTMHRTELRSLRDANRTLVKFCRATQLLPWMTRSFGFSHKPIHLIRHPCAVVASQIRHGAWTSVPARYSDSEIVSQPLLAAHAEILRKIDSVEGRLAASWALTNKIPLYHSQRETRWTSIFYEDLIVDPVQNLKSILTDWGLSLDSEIEHLALVPSNTTLPSSPIAHGSVEKQLAYWKNSLDGNQVRTILDTVHAIGVTLYDDRLHPNLTPER